MKNFIYVILFLAPISIFGQNLDTLSFYSPAFEEDRIIYIQTPISYKYKSDSVKLPVIYVLDGQFEWFVNPLLKTIEYLQFTKEIPQALVVIIPHKNRTTESAFQNLDQDLPLHSFITQDLEANLENYPINSHRTIIGHSFTSSFALYSYHKNPDFYEAVIANSPLHDLDKLIISFKELPLKNRQKLFISIGGKQRGKDDIHRNNYDKLNIKHPDFFNEINTFIAENSAHNAVPIVSNPTFLTETFSDFRSRLFHIAETEQEADMNGNYNLKNEPEAIEKEMNKILLASLISDNFYAPEISELNGIASRYLSGNYKDHAIMTYKLGLNYYPKFWGFYLALFELTLEENPIEAKKYLLTAEKHLNSLDRQFQDYHNVQDYISSEKVKNSW